MRERIDMSQSCERRRGWARRRRRIVRAARDGGLRLLASGLLLAGLASCGGSGPPSVGDRMPEYGAHDLAGDSVQLGALRGSPVLLNVWATWCHPCVKEMPELERLERRFGPHGLKIVGVSIDESHDHRAIRSFARSHGATYPIWHDPGIRIHDVAGTIGVPETFLIGADGTLLWRHLGVLRPSTPGLEERLREALGDTAFDAAETGVPR